MRVPFDNPFTKGDRVKLGGDWKDFCPEETVYLVGRKAEVVGFSRDRECCRVVFDGTKTPQPFHCTFLEAE